jgi:hypothetical protein
MNRIKPVDVDLRVVDHRDERVDRLTEMVRRDVRGHSDGDAGRAVDEEVRVARRQHLRLGAPLVVVRSEVNRCPRRCRAAARSRFA